MRQCPNCKTNNPDDARFCNYCGMRLPESKEETLYSDLEGLEEAPKVEFSDQEIAEESEKVIDEAKKFFEPDLKEDVLKEDLKEKAVEDPAVNLTEKMSESPAEDSTEKITGSPIENPTARMPENITEDFQISDEEDWLKKQLTIPEDLDRMIEKVTKEELERELHRKIKLREKDLKEQRASAEDPVDEPTRLIGDDSKEEADEPTRMFTGDIGDFIKKKKDYEDVPEEDAYEEILQSWERKRKEKKIRREKEGKDPSSVPKFIREKRSWSDLTDKQKKVIRRTALGAVIFILLCVVESYHGRPEAVAERYCKAYIQENWKKTGHLSDLPSNGYATLDEYMTYMKKNAVTGISSYQIKETKADRQTKIESGGKQRAFTVTYQTGKNKKTSETVILQKQESRKFLLFADWKASSDQMIAKDFNLYIPAGSKAWIDGTELTKNYKIKDDSDGLDQYKVSLFEGKHKIKVNVPWFEPYKSDFQASDKGSTTISKMQISESGKKKLDKKMKKILKAYVDAAKEGKAFSEVSGLFEKKARDEKENKEFYQDLKEQLSSADGYTTGNIELQNYESRYVISGITGVVRGTLSYDYKVTYSKEQSAENQTNGTAGQSGTEGNSVDGSADGSTQMSAEFVYKDGGYQLRSVNPGNIWYRDSQ